MTIQGTIEQLDGTEALVRLNDISVRLPLELLPAGSTIGQSVWVSADTSAPAVATPQAILNELLHPDDSQRTA